MLVIHSIWNRERLYFWAESSTLLSEGSKKHKRDLLKTHPFALTGKDLKSKLPETIGAAGSIEPLTLRLPSTKKSPLPSPWLLFDDPVSGKATGLKDWTVEALAFEPESAFDLLLDLPSDPPQGIAYGDSVRYWSNLAMLSMELLAREQFVPAIRSDKASWAAVIDEDDSERLKIFSESMPLSCRGFLSNGSPAMAPSPQNLVMSFIDSTVDSFVRNSLKDTELMPPRRGRRPKSMPLEQQFLRALSSEKSGLEAPAEDLASFSKNMQSWLSQLHPSEDVPYRTCFRLDPPEDDGDTWTIRFFLQAKDDRSLLVPAEEVWRTRSQTITFLKKRLKNPQEQLLADLGKATRIFPDLEQSLQKARPVSLNLETEEAYTFLRQFAPLLEQNGFGVLLPTWWEKPSARLGVKLKLKVKTPGPVSSPIAQGLFGLGALADYNWELALGDETITEAEFAQLARLKTPLVQLRGEWVELPVNDIEAAIEFFKKHGGKKITLGEALKLGLNERDEIKLDGKSSLPIVGVEAEGWIDDLLKTLSGRGGGELKPIKTPQGFKGTLRPYQAKGVSWLGYLSSFGLGACLADDMGLGKTIELIAFLLREREGDGAGLVDAAGNGDGAGRKDGSCEGNHQGYHQDYQKSNPDGNPEGKYDKAPSIPRPTLLICPMSVAGNWQRELERFAPSLKVMVHHGTDRLSGSSFADAAAEQDVVITTYSLAQRDVDDLLTVDWEHVVLDEAQNIKNQSARQTQAIKRLKSRQRIALTGTPVENRLSELWSIMDFLNPEYLGSAKSFRRDFVLPIERYRSKERSETLKGIIQPFVLRRLKTDPAIINDLPEKVEMKVNYNLTPEQASLYAAVVDEMLGKIEQATGIERKGQILSALTKLKQICNHPALFIQDGSPLPGRSGKLNRLDEMLYEVVAEGENALIFTQFAGMGAMLKAHLQEQLGREVLFLHGGTPKKQRDEMIQKFQSGGASIFILSLKAGGLGLNLTAANHVFHFDRWWNPAVENQATDRAFRIGQKKNVFVHKFVCLGTLEEKIDQMIEAKKALAESVIGTGETWLTELSNDALKDIFALRRDAVSYEGYGDDGGYGGD
jgi:SNF2 family DNA or RNA helicase